MLKQGGKSRENKPDNASYPLKRVNISLFERTILITAGLIFYITLSDLYINNSFCRH